MVNPVGYPGNICKIERKFKMENLKTNPLPQQLREARQEGIRQGKILATTKNLSMIMKNLHISIQDAMVLLEIPRKERKTYERILSSRTSQKAAKGKPDAKTAWLNAAVDKYCNSSADGTVGTGKD